MSNVGYLLARLPRLYATAQARPLGARRFLSLLGDSQLRPVCAAVLHWLEIANSEAQSLQLPLPFADAGIAETGTQPPISAWRHYYQRLGTLNTPVLVRRWAAQDRATIARRSAARGEVAAFTAPGAAIDTLPLLATPGDLAAAQQQDRQMLDIEFRRIDQHLYGCDTTARDHIYAYAIRLLLLARIGVPEGDAHAD